VLQTRPMKDANLFPLHFNDSLLSYSKAMALSWRKYQLA